MQPNTKSLFMRTVRITASVVVAGLLALLVLLVLLHFSVIGSHQLRTVVSGSMEPAIQTGSVVVIDDSAKAIATAEVGDIITYQSPAGSERTVTHRIIGVEADGFITQGDANNAADNEVVTPAQIIGTVDSSIPYAGYAAASIYTPIGLSMLVLVPSIIVIFTELRNIRRNIKRMRAPAYVVEPPQPKGSKVLTLVIVAAGFILLNVSSTTALFSAVAVSETNRLQTANVFLEDSVVINEVYYNVAEDKQGPTPNLGRYQWIELYNPTSDPVQLKGYRICASEWCQTIKPNTVLAPGEFALLSHDHNIWSQFWDGVHRDTTTINLGGTPYNALDTTADMLALENSEGKLIDHVNWGSPDESWANYIQGLWSPGVETAEQGSSIERIYTGGIVQSVDDWHSSQSPSPGTQ